MLDFQDCTEWAAVDCKQAKIAMHMGRICSTSQQQRQELTSFFVPLSASSHS